MTARDVRRDGRVEEQARRLLAAYWWGRDDTVNASVLAADSVHELAKAGLLRDDALDAVPDVPPDPPAADPEAVTRALAERFARVLYERKQSPYPGAPSFDEVAKWRDREPFWGFGPPEIREAFNLIDNCRETASVLASLPDDRLAEARAWDEGYYRGTLDTTSDLEPADNPYRAALSGGDAT